MLDERGSIPMVAPVDVGVAVADLLTRPRPATSLHFVEGHRPLHAGRRRAGVRGGPRSPVDVTVTPREGWVPAFREMGFSAEAAESYAGMVALATSNEIELPESPTRGRTTLQDYVETLVRTHWPATEHCDPTQMFSGPSRYGRPDRADIGARSVATASVTATRPPRDHATRP
jgi:hypothetical protein